MLDADAPWGIQPSGPSTRQHRPPSRSTVRSSQPDSSLPRADGLPPSHPPHDAAIERTNGPKIRRSSGAISPARMPWISSSSSSIGARHGWTGALSSHGLIGSRAAKGGEGLLLRADEEECVSLTTNSAAPPWPLLHHPRRHSPLNHPHPLSPAALVCSS